MTEQLVDVYLPDGPAELTIVYLHAGGWVAGGRADIPTTILNQLDRHRAVISAGYRLTTEDPWPAQIQDVDRAVRWIKLHAGEWGLDARRIVIAGGSAGGHLALFAAAAPGHLTADDLPPELQAIEPDLAGVVGLAAPSDIASMLWNDWGPPILERLLGCSFDCSPATLVDASPAMHVSADAPPLYIAGGAQDTLVPPDVNVFALAARWSSMIDPRDVWVDYVDNQGHNIDIDGVNVTALDEFLSVAVGTS